MTATTKTKTAQKPARELKALRTTVRTAARQLDHCCRCCRCGR